MAVSNPRDNINDIEINSFRKKMLAWYDKHQRPMPWRKTKGQKANPYFTWLSEIMLQQTTVVTVGPYFEKFIARWPSVHDLAAAAQADVMHEWAGLGYYARARNLHKCAQVISAEHGGVFPQTQEELEKLPGIGGYTSAALRAIAFNKPANVVDGNIERVMARLYAVQEPLPDSKPKLKILAAGLCEGRTDSPRYYAQALMDLGATICTPKSPKCMFCPVNEVCAAKAQGIAADLPRKKPKKAKPQKYGIAYWVENDQKEILFERRPDTVMLGGMLGLPTSEWAEDKGQKPLKGAHNTQQHIRHSFTHFDLQLDIYHLPYKVAHKNGLFLPENNHHWVELSKIRELGLPTLFSKIVKLTN